MSKLVFFFFCWGGTLIFFTAKPHSPVDLLHCQGHCGTVLARKVQINAEFQTRHMVTVPVCTVHENDQRVKASGLFMLGETGTTGPCLPKHWDNDKKRACCSLPTLLCLCDGRRRGGENRTVTLCYRLE
ncbi:hypothetical protein F5Y16DRAFT_385932 [Xylariaceae sp. FL0255]|nr:hypothetical protein F5Y16DRAFT_385932 [Xylariaceae sp. FL0255]